jgi:hypothetical protein
MQVHEIMTPKAMSKTLLVGSRVKLPSRPDSFGQIFESADGRLPVDTCVRDGDTLLESCWTLSRNLLVALIDVGLDHDTDDGLLAGAELITNGLCDAWLVAMILVGVA